MSACPIPYKYYSCINQLILQYHLYETPVPVGCSFSFTIVHSSFTTVHYSFTTVHYIAHFGSENRHEKDSQANTGCNVVRLCTLMSYDYRLSCRTFIATYVVRHDNLIKTAIGYSCLSLFKYTKT